MSVIEKHLEVYPSCGKGDLFAVADVGDRVGHIWVYSFSRQQLVCELDTIFGQGGKRLALIDGPEPLVVAGCFHRGAAGYSIPSGQLLWHRKDIKKLQHLDGLQWEGPKLEVGAGLDAGSYRILNARSGTWLRKTVGVRQSWSNGSGCRLENGTRVIRLTKGGENITLQKCEGEWGGSVLSASFSSAACAYSLVKGPIHCFDLSGKELWRWKDGARHTLSVLWAEHLKRWMAITWNYEVSGKLRMSFIKEDGTTESSVETGVGLGCIPVAGGRGLVTARSEVVSVPDLKVLWKLQT